MTRTTILLMTVGLAVAANAAATADKWVSEKLDVSSSTNIQACLDKKGIIAKDDGKTVCITAVACSLPNANSARIEKIDMTDGKAVKGCFNKCGSVTEWENQIVCWIPEVNGHAEASPPPPPPPPPPAPAASAPAAAKPVGREPSH